MSNTITIELCAEDRARLDRIIEGLAGLKPCECIGEGEPAETPNFAPQTHEASTLATTPETKETPTQAKETPPPTAEEPTVDQNMILQKVIQLCTENEGKKKARVRAIVTAYASLVSEIPDDKCAEVWAKLLALESED